MTTAKQRRPISTEPRLARRLRPRMPRVSLPRIPATKLSLPKLALPKVSGPRAPVPDVSEPEESGPKPPKGRSSANRVKKNGRDDGGDGKIHPKIAGRREAVAQQGRRRGRTLRWTGVGIAVVLTAAAALLFSPLFDLDHLLVEGVEGSPASEVSEAAGLDDNTAMFGIRAADVRANIEDLDWVANASVEVVWPDRVEVRVHPHRPVALLAVAGADPTGIVTASGRTFEFADVEPLVPFSSGLPVLRLEADPGPGDGPDSGELTGALAMLRDLGPSTAAVVAEATVDGAGRMTLSAGPGAVEGAELVVGSLDQLPEKAQALEAVLSGAVEPACLARLDVSVPSRVTIQRSAGCTIEGP